MSSQVLLCKLSFPHKQCSGIKSQASTIIQNSARRRLSVMTSDHSRRKSQLTRTSFIMDKSYCQIRKMETDVIAAAHVYPDPSSDSWKVWVVGMLLLAAVPFWNKFWPLLKPMIGEVETTMEAAEQAVEMVEKVAEEVEEVAEKVAELLPEGGKLEEAVTFVEKVAEETAKEAELVDGILEKVEENIDSLLGVGPQSPEKRE